MRCLVFLPLFAFCLARADVVECENGDRFNGKVLLVDETSVKLQNDVAGVLTIPRPKVAAITFGSKKSSPRPAATSGSAAPNLVSPVKPPQFDQSAIDQVQNQFLGDANPETTQMFQEMVRGLMSGKLDLGDIRSKAQTTLKELKDMQKDLGDDDASELLSSYASILENFVKSAPAAGPTNQVPATPKLSPNPSAPK